MTAQLATSLHRPPRPLDPAPPEIKAEGFSGIAYELLPLFRQHHAEAGLEQEAIPLDPDWDRLFAIDLAGGLYVTTARADKLLIGYAVSVVTTSLWHAGTRAAHLELIYLDPLYRQGWLGYTILKQHINGLQQGAVRVIKAEASEQMLDGRLAVLLKRLGMKPIERGFYKLLEPAP